MAIIGIIIAIAIPGLMRSRAAGQETSAIGTLRAIIAAQASYAGACGSGTFAPSLTNLGVPATAGGDPWLSANLATDPALKSNYTIQLTAGVLAVGNPASCNGAPAGATTLTYFVGADPVDAFAGVRHFGANQGGAIYQSVAAVAVTQTGPPAGATAIQ